MKKNIKDEYKELFKDVSFSKIIPYRNIKDGKSFILERVNPNHIGVIWGKPKRKHSTFVKFAKVYFSVYPVGLGFSVLLFLGVLTDKVFFIIGKIGLYSIVMFSILTALFYLPLILQAKKEVASYC